VWTPLLLPARDSKKLSKQSVSESVSRISPATNPCRSRYLSLLQTTVSTYQSAPPYSMARKWKCTSATEKSKPKKLKNEGKTQQLHIFRQSRWGRDTANSWQDKISSLDIDTHQSKTESQSKMYPIHQNVVELSS
jgi:hypothetical protein